mgnify:CR=1 FL=1
MIIAKDKMKRNSSIDKASDFWSGTKISDIVMNIFNCGCGPRESKDQKHALDNELMEDEGTAAPPKQFKFNKIPERDRSQSKNENSQVNFTFTFGHGLENNQSGNNFPDFHFDEEEGDSEMSRDRSSLFAGGDDDTSKLTETEERLSTASKKISRKSKKTAEKANEKKTAQARRPWQPHEDKMLLELMKELGPAWAAISKRMGGTRSGKQVRDRYLNKLDPKIKNSEWTEEEDDLLVSLYYKLGKKWSEIAKNIPGRTESMVKNRVQWRFRWMVSDNAEGVEQYRGFDPNTKKEESQNILDEINNSNLMIPEEANNNIGFNHYQPQNQPLEMDFQEEYAQETRNQPIFENFENAIPQQNFFPQDRMQIDSIDFPQQNFNYPQFNGNFQDPDNFSLVDYFDKRGSNPLSENLVAKPDPNQLYHENLTPFEVNNQQNRQSGGYFDLPATRDISSASEDQKIQERINYISSILKSYPNSENWSESLQKPGLDSGVQGMSKEDAAKRVELLRQRLVNLETILQATYQQVFEAHGKEFHPGK